MIILFVIISIDDVTSFLSELTTITTKDGDFGRRGRSYSYDTDNNRNGSRSKDRSRDGADYFYYRNPDDSQRRPSRPDSYDDYNCDDGGRRRPQPDPRLPRRYREDDHHSFKPHQWIDQERGRGQQRSRSQSVEHDDTDQRKGREILNKDDDENTARNQEQQKNKVPKEWPPQFDEEPSSFVFDARSGMFWEGESQFFYDPKTKLYYSNRQAVYYRYDSNEKPPFVEFQKVAPSESNQDVTDVVSATTLDGDITSPSTAPGIKIAIKTKKLKRSSIQAKNDKEPSNQTVKVSSDQVTSTGTPSSLSKEKQNIEKWSRQQQLRQKKEDGNVSPTQEEGATKTKPKVRTTAKGEPICLICKRKFPTLAKLQLHEKASQLHKQNLEKLKTEAKQKLEDSRKRPADAMSDATASKTATAATTYVDRAEKRRLMHHGTDPSSIKEILSRKICSNAMPLPSDLTTTHNATTTPITPAGADLNSNNVGHKMLQKMGWKANIKGPSRPSDTGAVITSDSPASGDASKNNNRDAKITTMTTNRLRQDWDKIEAIARMNSRK
mmetsp:Transcript_37145/g.90052  ORF Transcript_37145/g.90052 Transcript_37145/m.90052 type:complete len:552 (-) Transcript_37145:64-1719(-)